MSQITSSNRLTQFPSSVIVMHACPQSLTDRFLWLTCSLTHPISISGTVFGREDISFILNQGERTKAKEEDSLHISPAHVNTKERKRVKFDIAFSPTLLTREAGCQTDETLMPQMR